MKKCPTFGSVIRKIRQDKGVSQENLADLLDMNSNAYISRLENDKKSPTLDMIFKVANALGVRASDIIKEIEKTEDS